MVGSIAFCTALNTEPGTLPAARHPIRDERDTPRKDLESNTAILCKIMSGLPWLNLRMSVFSPVR